MKRIFILTIASILMLSLLLLSGCDINKTTDGDTHAHAFGEWKVAKEATCTEDGSIARTCSCGESEKETISAFGHTEETVPGTPATCTESGLTDGKKCTVCGEFTVNQEIIPALKHEFVCHTETDENGNIITVAVCQREGCGEALENPAGLYDAENNLLVSWCDFVNVYGLKIDNGAISNLSKFYENCEKTEILIKGTTLIFDDSITNINLANFIPFKNLANILIPSSVTIINTSTWECCVNIKNIIVDENNEHYKSIDGNLYDKEGKTLIKYAGGKDDAEFTIPSGVTEIGECAFTYSNHLEKIIIHDGVTKIGSMAFYLCDLLKDIYFEGTEEQWTALEYTKRYMPDSVFIHYGNKIEFMTMYFLHYSGASRTYRLQVILENENIYIGDRSVALYNQVGYVEGIKFTNADSVLWMVENQGNEERLSITQKFLANERWYVLERTLDNNQVERILISKIDNIYYFVSLHLRESSEIFDINTVHLLIIK